jgi:hypothetical protein
LLSPVCLEFLHFRRFFDALWRAYSHALKGAQARTLHRKSLSK